MEHPSSARPYRTIGLIPIEEIPKMALATIVNGGVIDFTGESTVDFPVFTIARRADGKSDVLKPLRESLDSWKEHLKLE